MGIVKNLCRKSIQNKTNEALKGHYQIGKSGMEMSERERATKEELLEWRRSLVISCLSMLDPKCEALLSGYYFEELNMKQLSIRLGYSSDNVAKSKKFKCMKKLIELVHQQVKSYTEKER